MTIGTWNVRTLLDLTDNERPHRRTAIIAHELKRYGIDIAALSETRLSEEGSLTEVGEGYTFFWKGLPEGVQRNYGVAFAVKTSMLSSIPQSPIGVSEHLMSWRIPLTNSRYATLISAYAPTLDAEVESKDRFYSQLHTLFQSVPHDDKIILLGDFNAGVGHNHQLWQGIMGRHGVGKCNDNGLRLLTFCSQHSLVITNTCFQLRDMFKTTWMHPRSKTWHILDYAIVRRKDLRDVVITRAMRGADGWTDHRLVRTTMKLCIRPPARRQPPLSRLNLNSLNDPVKRNSFQEIVGTRLSDPNQPIFPPTQEGLNQNWDHVSNILLDSATSILGTTKRKHRDWFNEQAPDIHNLLEEKSKAHQAAINNPNATTSTTFAEARSKVQHMTRSMQNEWWLKLAGEIQGFADIGNQQEFYCAIKRAYGPQRTATSPVRSVDGSKLITDKKEILDRWAEHYQHLLNRSNPSDPTVFENLPEFPRIPELDNMPTRQEVHMAIISLKNNKAAGPDGIPAEILKHGGNAILDSLHDIFQKVWAASWCPQKWKDADIVSIFKKKGDRAVCGNSRGISLLATSGKVLTRILLSRLLAHTTEGVLPESQSGFRKERSTVDMVFIARQLQEKAIEQQQDLYMVFVDLAKAFDTVNRTLLWEILRKFGCPPTFLAVLKSFHDGSKARVTSGGSKSDPFFVGTGVKQGCVIAPIIFNLFVAAVMTIAKQNINPADGVQISYRLDGNLFNLRRLQAKTLVTLEAVHELQYADDTAFVSSSPDGLQRTINAVAEAYSRSGLAINTGKTEVLNMCQPPIPVLLTNQQPLKNVEEFTYLGSVLSNTNDLSSEVQRRIGLASASFGVKWWHKVPHTEIRNRACIDPIETILSQRQLRWLGHTIRMPANRLPRKILYSELAEGSRRAEGPKKRFKDHMKTTLKKCAFNPSNLEVLASNRKGWQTMCRTGSERLTTDFNRAAEQRRLRRHAPQNAGGNFPCNACGRICKSRIGLTSHQKVHQP
ncbi:transposon TX1 uncharacterized 149 kDa protein [Penaeus vannamei]|uniref:transposon TX1 uncharacterized 149 kDa protein n=1 Tax=Penaeus vannamei TaxID=6689 RepID=UPI00387F9898